jgi:hypothetical protein
MVTELFKYTHTRIIYHLTSLCVLKNKLAAPGQARTAAAG